LNNSLDNGDDNLEDNVNDYNDDIFDPTNRDAFDPKLIDLRGLYIFFFISF